MSTTAECPYCKTENRIDEFPGEGRDVDVECRGCGRDFIATGQIAAWFDSRCKEGQHDWADPLPGNGLVLCKVCDAFKRGTEPEA